MKQIENKEALENVASFIKERRDKCIYLYVNLANYDGADENVKVYVDDEKEIKAVFLLYYNTLHICYDCLNDKDANQYLAFIKSINPNYSQPPLCFYQK